MATAFMGFPSLGSRRRKSRAREMTVRAVCVPARSSRPSNRSPSTLTAVQRATRSEDHADAGMVTKQRARADKALGVLRSENGQSSATDKGVFSLR